MPATMPRAQSDDLIAARRIERCNRARKLAIRILTRPIEQSGRQIDLQRLIVDQIDRTLSRTLSFDRRVFHQLNRGLGQLGSGSQHVVVGRRVLDQRGRNPDLARQQGLRPGAQGRIEGSNVAL